MGRGPQETRRACPKWPNHRKNVGAVALSSGRSTLSAGFIHPRGEDRFLALLWPRISLIVDADDRSKAVTGRYYTREQPLTAASIKKEPGI